VGYIVRYFAREKKPCSIIYGVVAGAEDLQGDESEQTLDGLSIVERGDHTAEHHQ